MAIKRKEYETKCIAGFPDTDPNIPCFNFAIFVVFIRLIVVKIMLVVGLLHILLVWFGNHRHNGWVKL